MINRQSRSPAYPLYLLFFLSGGAALIYEVIWMRMLALTLGVTAPAVAAVLAAFMGGLALGSGLGGRALDRWGRPLLWYAGCELAIALYAVAFPLLYRFADGAYLLLPFAGAAAAPREIIRFVVAAALLVVPTAAMGATTPAITAAVRERTGGASGRSFAAAYAANTFGAVAGAALGGFWLLWAAGASLSLGITAALNAAVALLAFLLHVTSPRPTPAPPGLITQASSPRSPMRGRIYAAAFVMGAVALAAQVLWTRVLSNVVGSATYAFTAMLTVILLGVASGALAHRHLRLKWSTSPHLYPALCLTAAAALSLSIFVLSRAPLLFLQTFMTAGGTFPAALLTVFLLSFLALFLPSAATGMVLPVAVAAARGDRPDRDVGGVYAANTAGAIAGSLLGTFVILPNLGPVVGLRSLAVAATAAAFLWGLRRRRWVVGGALAAAAVACVVPGPRRHDLAAGVGISPSYYLNDDGKVDLSDAAKEKLIYYADGVDASVAVVEYGAVRSLKINGKVVASTNHDDLRVERMLGDLPIKALAHPKGASCLVVGLGTGITAGACAASPDLSRVVVCEINPAVAPASRFFDAWSGSPLDDPRVEFVRADGRSYVRSSPCLFNVITSDPIHPWTKGSAALYTVEHFRNCGKLLPRRGEGVMAQWVPLYQLSPRDYFTVIRSFAAAFRHVALYYAGRDTVLLGHNGAARWPGEYAPYLIAEGETLRAAAARGLINTEDNMVLEYTAPRSVYVTTEADNLRLLAGLRSPAGDDRYVAVNHLIAGRLAYIEGEDAAAAAEYERALALWPDNEDARYNLADVTFDQALAAAEGGDLDAARAMFRRVLELQPEDVAARRNLELLGY